MTTPRTPLEPAATQATPRGMVPCRLKRGPAMADEKPRPPSFWILDGYAVDGRDGLYGMATTTRGEWWTSDYGRLYSGRHGAWGCTNVSWDAPISVTVQPETATTPRRWVVLCARGKIVEISKDGESTREVEVQGPLRRVRMIGPQVVAVGAHGQI